MARLMVSFSSGDDQLGWVSFAAFLDLVDPGPDLTRPQPDLFAHVGRPGRLFGPQDALEHRHVR